MMVMSQLVDWHGTGTQEDTERSIKSQQGGRYQEAQDSLCTSCYLFKKNEIQLKKRQSTVLRS